MTGVVVPSELGAWVAARGPHPTEAGGDTVTEKELETAVCNFRPMFWQMTRVAG